MEQAKYVLDWEKSLESGINKYNNQDPPYDVILLDLSLPDSSGIATVEKLITRVSNTTIIVLTGLNDEKYAIQALKHGAQDYLVKDEISANLLNRSIQYSMERYELSRAVFNSQREYKKISNQLKAIIENIGDGVIATNREGIINFINRSAVDLIIENTETIDRCIDKHLIDCIRIKDESLTRVFTDLFGTCGDSIEFNNACRNILLKNGSNILKHINIRCSPIRREENNSVDGYVFIFEDITNSVKLQEEVIKSQKLESVGFLAGGIAHDFNNLLMTVLGNIFIAKKQFDIPPELNAMADNIEKVLMDAKSLTTQLLQFTEHGELEKPETLDVGTLVREYVNFTLSGTNLTPEFDFDDDLWNIQMDRTLFSQIINNMVINAVQATPQGGILKVGVYKDEISSNANLPLEPGHYVRLVFQDEGCGIPDDLKQKIFEPYFTTKEHGNGLGLATSFSIVRNNGGHITVQSKVNEGTTFSIYLPRCEQEASCEVEKTLNLDQFSGRALIMDDEAPIRQILNQMLTSAGYEVVVTSKGEEMIEEYKRSKENGEEFDFLVLDHTVKGGLGGIETINEIHQIDPNAKAVISSGHNENALEINFTDIGFVASLPKPYTMEELYDVLKKVIKRK